MAEPLEAPNPWMRWLPVLLLAGTALIFAPVVGHEFVIWDDTHNLLANPDMNPPSLAAVVRYWTNWREGFADLYAPLTYTLWAAVAVVSYLPSPGGPGTALNPHLFHALNLILHLASAYFAWRILRHAFRRPLAAFAGAALFACHPVQVEPVAWVSGMKDVLSGMLALLAIWQYLAFAAPVDAPPVRARELTMPPRSPILSAGSIHYAIATAAFVLAMLAKPAAVVVPLVTAIFLLGVMRRPIRSAAPLAFWLILTIPIALIAWRVQKTEALTFVPALWQRPLVALDTLAFYTRQLIAPIWLGVDYGRSPHWLLSSPQRYVTWIVPFGIAVAAYLLRRKAPYLPAGCGIFLAGVLPVLGLVPFDFQVYSTPADHYLYLAMLGLAVLLAGLLDSPRPRTPAIPAAAVLAILALAIASHVQTWVWQDSQSLFENAVRVNPASLAGNVSLGKLHADAAEAASRARDPQSANAHADRAIAYGRAALDTAPDDPQAHHNLAKMLAFRNRLPEAETHFRIAVKAWPGSPAIRTSLGAVLARQEKYAEAIEAFEAALALDPTYPVAQKYLEHARELARRATTRPAESSPPAIP